jgi:hypothetical protein
MTAPSDFVAELEAKVAQQLRSQRVGYLLGAGSSYLDGAGYPLAFQLWELIKDRITDARKRADIQAKLDGGATGLEHALDLLDDGGASDTPYRHLVTAALADLFMPIMPPLELHAEFVRRIAYRPDPYVKVFSLNYDPLIERTAAKIRARVVDGFLGGENSYFDAGVFEERTGRIRGTHRGRQFDETVKPIHLFKLHGSLGWYECIEHGVRKCGFVHECTPASTRKCGFGANPAMTPKPLMIPPQRRKAADTMYPPYSALWSAFRGCLGQNAAPINRLACLGYGFADEHVNAVIEAALARTDFTLLVFTMSLSNMAWERWSPKENVVVVTKDRCALKGKTGPGHADLWSFERLAKEV